MGAVQRLFSEGFRIFFLAAGLFALAVGGMWTLWLMSDVPRLDQLAMSAQTWHAHEMIFGYGTAAIGGFFLTAVPNWTNTPSAKAVFIASVFGLWLVGRVAVWLSGALPAEWVMGLDLLFVPVLAAKVLAQLLKRPKPQNMVFLSMLAALWAGNLMTHLEWIGVTDNSAALGLRVGLVTLACFIAVLGGRVTPAFTKNAMKRADVPEQDWPKSIAVLDRATMVLALALPWCVASGVQALAAGVAVAVGLLQMARLAGWRTRWTVGQPILWSLHIGMGFLALGLLMWGLSGLGIGSEVAGLHVLGIGCVGAMTLAVMSRAVLGHTGRALVAPRFVVWSYGAIAASALVRLAGQTVLTSAYELSLMLTGGLWVLAFGLFLIGMAPMLVAPRVSRDG